MSVTFCFAVGILKILKIITWNSDQFANFSQKINKILNLNFYSAIIIITPYDKSCCACVSEALFNNSSFIGFHASVSTTFSSASFWKSRQLGG